MSDPFYFELRHGFVGTRRFSLTYGGAPVNITGAAVLFRARPVTSGAAIAFEKAGSVVNGAAGEIEVSFDGDDFSGSPSLTYGDYRVIFVINSTSEYPDGRPLTMRVVQAV